MARCARGGFVWGGGGGVQEFCPGEVYSYNYSKVILLKILCYNDHQSDCRFLVFVDYYYCLGNNKIDFLEKKA